MTKYIDVINLHLTEKCNFRCEYCFAKFNNDSEFNLDEWKLVVDKISTYFNKYNLKGRINLAGGEPMLLSWLDELIDYILSKNIEVSIITNASFLTKKRIDNFANKVSMIGVSIDSINEETNKRIGRCTKSGKTINYNELVDILNFAKKFVRLKVNTVVSKLNLNEDISPLYNDVSFDRIKLLQVRINKGGNEYADIHSITKKEFDNYCNKIKGKVSKEIVCESSDEIENSYTFIDPHGFLISNDNSIHAKVGKVLDNDLELLMKKSKVDVDKFLIRYK